MSKQDFIFHSERWGKQFGCDGAAMSVACSRAARRRCDSGKTGDENPSKGIIHRMIVEKVENRRTRALAALWITCNMPFDLVFYKEYGCSKLIFTHVKREFRDVLRPCFQQLG